MRTSAPPKVCATIAEMRAACREMRAAGKRLGFVPTMGALHAGHLSLVRAARARCDAVAVSIFVNPTQFGPKEDLAKYPRTFRADCAALEKEGVDSIFAPAVEEMYPAGAVTWVTVEGLSEKLDGRSRPGHFRGVSHGRSQVVSYGRTGSGIFRTERCRTGGDHPPHGARFESGGGNCGSSDCARGRWAGHEFAQCVSGCGSSGSGRWCCIVRCCGCNGWWIRASGTQAAWWRQGARSLVGRSQRVSITLRLWIRRRWIR